ncbi:MAG TPA: S8 family serine peptidase [Vicinamibacterales bacterium]|nr:S8 family serine peptidase [Vicinamibacterales bacterium]
MTWERARIDLVRSAGVVVVAFGTLAFGSRIAAQSPPARRAELLVKFRPGATPAERQAALARAGAKLRKRFARTGIEHVEIAAGDRATGAVPALASDPAVLYAQPNFIRRAVAAGAPNDPAWTGNVLWGLARVSAPSAWAAFPPSARDVVVAVIDSGINYRHPDLAGSAWVNRGEVPGNGLDDDGNGYVDDVHGIDAWNHDSDPMDDNGHGTHAAGIIGAQGDNGIGAVGVAWNPQIVACKFLDATGTGNDAAAITCFEYLMDLKVNRGVNLRIASNSWGSPRDPNAPYPHALRDTIDAAAQAGIISVFAAGNDGGNDDAAPYDPASFTSPSIVSVAASDENDARAAFSNYGATAVDIAAPGTNIFSTYWDGYAYSSGTSMAAPHVSGTLALMASQNPALTPAALKQILLASADRLPQWSGVTVTGARLNVFAAVVASTETSTAPSGAVGEGWSHVDVGATGAAGRAAQSNGVFEVAGAGADVWGTADAFHYAYRTLDGDGTIVARVTGIQFVSNWTKAGVMIRGSLSPSAAQAFMLVAASPAKGVPFQRRTVDGGTSTSSPGSLSTAPRWVKLVRSGATISGYESADGATWTRVGGDTFTLGRSVLIGLAVSSHVAGTTAAATFDNVSVVAGAAAPAAAVWSHGDIGATPIAGNATGGAGAFTVTGSGADVWGAADAFHYAYTTLTGDGSIVARVSSVQMDVNAWVKAGVMVRASLTAGSPHAFMLVSAGKGAAFQRRRVDQDISVGTAGSFTTAPRWVKLQRTGSQISAFESPDGTTWTLVGADTIAMGPSIYVGVAVTSHTTAAAATCTFDNVTVR